MSTLATSSSDPAAADRAERDARRRRRVALGVLALLALGAHGGLFVGIGVGAPGTAAAFRNAALDVRSIAAEPPPNVFAETEPVVQPAEVPVAVAPRPQSRAAAPREAASARATPPDSAASAAAYEAALASAASAPASTVEAPTEVASAPVDDVASTVASSQAASAAVVAQVASASAASDGVPLVEATEAAASAASGVASMPGDLVVPTYRTQIPPPMTMTYEVRRGFFRVKGEARWRPTEGAYRAELEAKLGGVTALGWTSEGTFDSAGIAPVRFTDKRLNRMNAANFQRAANKITFSGNTTELPIPAGAQDRFSYLFQLAAVLSGEPERVAPGGTVAMYVVGARADAGVWVLRYVGFEFVETVDGAVRAARFTRDARGPYDSTIDVWVDPARYYLPVRAKQRSGNDEIDILLETMMPG